jgi:hypothetical protein
VGASWALLWIANCYWPESAELELGEELEVHANYDGLLLQPFMSSREVEEARRDVSEDTIMLRS